MKPWREQKWCLYRHTNDINILSYWYCSISLYQLENLFIFSAMQNYFFHLVSMLQKVYALAMSQGCTKEKFFFNLNIKNSQFLFSFIKKKFFYFLTFQILKALISINTPLITVTPQIHLIRFMYTAAVKIFTLWRFDTFICFSFSSSLIRTTFVLDSMFDTVIQEK